MTKQSWLATVMAALFILPVCTDILTGDADPVDPRLLEEERKVPNYEEQVDVDYSSESTTEGEGRGYDGL